MADNTILPGTGDVIASDDIGGSGRQFKGTTTLSAAVKTSATAAPI